MTVFALARHRAHRIRNTAHSSGANMNAKRDEAVQSNHKPRYTVLSTGSGAIHLFVALALIEIKTGQPNVQPMLGYVEL